MNRKQFLTKSGTIIAGAGFFFSGTLAANQINDKEVSFSIPPYLQPGDVVGITAPAGFITLEEIQPAVQVLQSWGYTIKIGNTIGKRDFTFGGTDAERLADFQQMLDENSVKAVLCARGGYGSLRIIDGLNWKAFQKKPKWIIGFSDVTVFHCHIHRNYKVASLHSKMCNSFPDDWTRAEPIQVQTINSIHEALAGKKMEYRASPRIQNKLGNAKGILIGGNLKTLETLAATASDISTEGKILFVEDTAEYLYSIDRMFWNLKRTGKLKALQALIVGGFNLKPDDVGEEFGKTLQDIVLEKVQEYAYPVCFNFPVGHQRANFALKCGVCHELQVTNNEVRLIEIV